MSKILIAFCIVGLFLRPEAAYSEWSGYFKQGYQRRNQLYNPQEVRSWLSDTVSSATPHLEEKGPVTEIETIWDFNILPASFSAGLFTRVLEYADATYHYLVSPLLKYKDDYQTLTVGRYLPGVWGSGLLLSNYPVLGVNYSLYWSRFESKLFYHAVFERSDFQKADINYFGFSETLHLSRGQIGFLYVYDDSESFSDASRDAITTGAGVSLQADWEAENDWYLQGEIVYAEALAVFMGTDLSLLSFMPLQVRLQYMDEGFNPLFGLFSREGLRQTRFTIRFPLNFFSEQLIITPEWGVKHMQVENFWLPGFKIETILSDTLWLHFRLLAEQPFSSWGAYRHFEYTELKIVWLITEYLCLDIRWTKTFNGFLDWKETKSQSAVELKW